jgi:DNA-binding NarL/FixJ family response regulator
VPTRVDLPLPECEPDGGKIRVVSVAIIDDQPVTRAGMEQLVAAQASMRVAASVRSIDELDARPGNTFDLAVVALPTDADAALHLIATVAPIARPVVTATWTHEPTLSAAIRAGASACITRHSEPEAVAAALRVAASGGLYLCSQLLDQFHAELQGTRAETFSGLAPREIETLQWIARGYTQSQIATRMGLSQATVNTYAKRVRYKLNVGNKAELTRMAIELGYLGHERGLRRAA